jgi:hypothetical protein
MAAIKTGRFISSGITTNRYTVQNYTFGENDAI